MTSCVRNMDHLQAEPALIENEEQKSLDIDSTKETSESKVELKIDIEKERIDSEDVEMLDELDEIQNETAEELSEFESEFEVEADWQRIGQSVEPNAQDKTLDWWFWLDRLVPTKKHRIILIDVDIIDKESSELRIIKLEIFLILVLSVVVMIQMGSFWISTSKQPIVVMPQIGIDKEFMPMSRLALIDENSTVWDVSLAHKLPSQGKLFKLPNSKQYFGYSDPHGVLYFIDGELRKSVTKYHKTFNHRNIKIDTFDDMNYQEYSRGQQIGNFYWLLARFMEPGDLKVYQQETHLWSTKKQGLVMGPDLPPFIDVSTTLCTCSINATHLVIAFLEETDEPPFESSFVHLRMLNFHENIWLTIGQIEYKNPDYPEGCNIALMFDKVHQSKILVQIQLIDSLSRQLSSIEMWTCEPRRDTFGLWTKLSMPFPQLSRIVYIGIIQGIIHLVTENGKIFQWDSNGSWTLIASQHVKTTFVIPYIVHH